MITVAFTVSCARQKYLRQALESWRKVRGVQDIRLLFCLEPPGSFPVDEFQAWAQESFAHVHTEVNECQLGCAANTRRAISRAFELGADFAVLAEEDLVVSTDVLEYFAWAQDHYRSDGRVKAVCAHSRSCAHTVPSDLAVLVNWFNPSVWGTWPDRWKEYLAIGLWPEGWDHALRRRIATDGLSVFPGRSRAKHIGQVSTISPLLLSHYFFQGSVSSCFAPDYPEQDYHEQPRTPELQLVV